MNELEREFVRQSSADLSSVLTCIEENQSAIFPEDSLHLVFRTLHSIKGTAQTFGFSAAGNLAHSLENLVSAAKTDANSITDFKSVLHEGISLLINSFGQKDFQIPHSFAARIEHLKVNLKTFDFSETFDGEIPAPIFGQLSGQEKSNLNSALKRGGNLLILEVGFDLPTFAAEFKEFRDDLSKQGEIIAALACPKFAAHQKIGFLIVFASNESSNNFVAKHPAEVIFEFSRSFPNSLPGVLAKIVGHGKNSAGMLGKNVEFIVLSGDLKFSDTKLKLIFDLLLQLVRNAVSHAIIKKGKVEIGLKIDENNLILSVADNGKGLDTEKIKATAIEKNLKQDLPNLTEREILDLIFLPEFSTAENVTEISGRGIGLDIVKNLTEKAGGKIRVETEKHKGTTFKIYLPKTF